MMRIIILLGAPGSGKGTQADMLAKKLGLKKISTGDLLRNIIKDSSPLAEKVRDVMNSGRLVEDDLIIDVIKERISKKDCQKGIILDGFPRTINQSNYLDLLLEDDAFHGSKVDIILMDVDNGRLIERITGRFSCSNCLRGYHDKFMQPKINGVCDNCGGNDFIRRKDDNIETVKNRLQVYEDDTSSIIDFYEKSDRLKVVDANKDADLVYSSILNSLAEI